MSGTIIFNADGSQTVIAGQAADPDAISDDDVRILRRVLIRFLSDSGQTVPQIRARFAAAKRQVD